MGLKKTLQKRRGQSKNRGLPRESLLSRRKPGIEKVAEDRTAKVGVQEVISKEITERLAAMETSTAWIAEHVQRQNAFNVSTQTSINCRESLVETTKTTSRKWYGSSKSTSSTLTTMGLSLNGLHAISSISQKTRRTGCGSEK